MKKWIFSLALAYTISLGNTSTQMMIGHDHSEAPQKFQSTDHEYLLPSSVETKYLSVKAMSIKGFSGQSLTKMQEALALLEQVVNTEEFKDRIINFKNSKGEREFASNKGLTNEEIYEHFMEGREDLQKETPGEMNFYLNLYNKWWSRVIGYTAPTYNTIYINWKYFKNFSPSSVASNLAHEWTHKIGFDHVSAKEHDSVPYAIGYIVGDIAEKMSKKTKLH